MTDEKKYVSHILFENKLLKSSGQQFQDLFVQIMQHYDSDFKPVKPYGNLGDKKNDGFNSVKGKYYQVYSPDDIDKANTIETACKKLKDDFDGLYRFWNGRCPIREFTFVINDKMKGIPVQLHNALLVLKEEYPAIVFDFLTSRELSTIVSCLEENDLEDILGFIPSLEVSGITASDLSEVINYLLNVEVDLSFGDKYVVPDFYEKIKFNGLGEKIRVLLDEGSTKEGLLQEFFNENPSMNYRLQLRMRILYHQVVEEIPADEEDYGNRRFIALLGKVVNGTSVKQSFLSCFYAIIAFYFSSCDIFEEPMISNREESV